MGISVTNLNNRIRHISITGELEDQIEVENFLTLLKEVNNAQTHITFLDACILSYKIIEQLAKTESYGSLKIHVVKSYLYSYMHKLGIKCNYVSRKLTELKLPLVKYKNVEVELDKKEVLSFLHSLRIVYDYNYTEYQIDSIIRRIKISMLKAGTGGFDEFQHLVLSTRSAFEQLFLDFSINTTEFFRNPQVFFSIKDNIFSYLNSYPHIRIWCAGCSTGEEPYSLAILLKEAGLLYKTQVYATDINPYVIEEGRNGLYSIENIKQGVRNYREAGGENNFINYFELKGNYMKVKDEIKKNVLFFQHSLLSNGIINEFQLILCRNVLIYFNNDLQRKVLEYFSYSLDSDGFLMMGKSEGMLKNGGERWFSKYDELNKIYRMKHSP